jgi:hypothetical protein
MTYQNASRLPIIDQTLPMSTFTLEQDVFGDEDGMDGWFIVERSVIDGVNILPFCFGTHAEARAQLNDILA